jgi:DNA-binding HxlR family transcriptional regulator
MSAPDPAGVPASPSDCRARKVLDRIGDKWSLHVIHLLGGGTRRFSDLRRSIDGISQRMLTVTLRGLERDGMVGRTVYPTVPPRVDYTLTPLGRTLHDTACSLIAWADEHVSEIDAAQAAYDRRSLLLSASLDGHPEPDDHLGAADDPGDLAERRVVRAVGG